LSCDSWPQLEERKRLEAANKGLVAEELDRCRLDVEAERAQAAARTAAGKMYSEKEGEELEVKVAEMKAEKSVVTLRVGSFAVFKNSSFKLLR